MSTQRLDSIKWGKVKIGGKLAVNSLFEMNNLNKTSGRWNL